MDEFLNKINWPLLAKQKLTLLGIIEQIEYRDEDKEGSPDADDLAGILNLIDALQDEASLLGHDVTWLTEGEQP